MKTLLYGSAALTAALVLTLMFVQGPAEAPEEEVLAPVCRAQVATNLTAVISSLSNEVSNGTPTQLDGRDSHVDDGYIVSYSWAIEHAGDTEYLSGMTKSYVFSDLGAYDVTLSVTDNESNVAETSVSVYTVVDVDLDKLPDWWEAVHFGNDVSAQDGDGDPDDDGYSNLQEYASDTDPMVWDPKPTLMQTLTDNWYFLVAAAAVAVALVVFLWPRMKKKRKEIERKKIEAALEIEKALGEEK
ncbi:MAG: PKD domain-containing protein [Thermoplasmata archaeon]|jgi:hypothetical protein|nr:PKD domain-containing protein [Thermoplasmata archaeon]